MSAAALVFFSWSSKDRPFSKVALSRGHSSVVVSTALRLARPDVPCPVSIFPANDGAREHNWLLEEYFRKVSEKEAAESFHVKNA